MNDIIKAFISLDFESIDTFNFQTCTFMVGDYDNTKIRMFTNNLNQAAFTTLDQNAILDYSIELRKISKVVTWDSFDFTSDMNFTNGGFELIMKRHKLKYIINYYLSPGTFVVVSWVLRITHFQRKYCLQNYMIIFIKCDIMI